MIFRLDHFGEDADRSCRLDLAAARRADVGGPLALFGAARRHSGRPASARREAARDARSRRAIPLVTGHHRHGLRAVEVSRVISRRARGPARTSARSCPIHCSRSACSQRRRPRAGPHDRGDCRTSARASARFHPRRPIPDARFAPTCRRWICSPRRCGRKWPAAASGAPRSTCSEGATRWDTRHFGEPWRIICTRLAAWCASLNKLRLSPASRRRST